MFLFNDDPTTRDTSFLSLAVVYMLAELAWVLSIAELSHCLIPSLRASS